MNAPTDFAPLNAGLLARKGEALPALSQSTKTMADTGLFASGYARATSDGKKCAMSDPSKAPHQSGEAASLKTRREAENQPLPKPEPPTLPQSDAGSLQSHTARVSFRMPMADYLRLKMAGQILDKPGRDIVLEALDRYLTDAGLPDMNDCACLSRHPKQA